MKKNIIIIVLFVAVVLLGIYGRLQLVEARNLKTETFMIMEEVKMYKHRSEMIATEAEKQAARAVANQAKTLMLEEELDKMKSKLASCK
ncbi:MAG: hypothetical protein NXI20_21385 [bacterium]|nr:hypothetical protein [bacterium]